MITDFNSTCDPLSPKVIVLFLLSIGFLIVSKACDNNLIGIVLFILCVVSIITAISFMISQMILNYYQDFNQTLVIAVGLQWVL